MSTTTASSPQREPPEERRRRKVRLAAALRIFGQRGFDEGAGGHMTARDPIQEDCFWVNALGQSFSTISASDLLLVDADGQVVAGEGRVNPAGYAIHSAIHEARPDVVAAAHTHSVYGRTWSTLGRLLDPLTQDACAFFEDHTMYDEYSGVVEDEEGQQIAAALGSAKATILANHGLLTVGGSVEEAAWWFIAMDRCCQVQMLAESTGSTPRPIPAEAARKAREVIGSPGLGRLNFRPLLQAVLHQHPDIET